MSDIHHSESLDSLRRMYSDYFSLGSINSDINTKFALISLICHLTKIVQSKKFGVTHYNVIKQIVKDSIPDAFCRSLSVICEDFSYNCTEFPVFGIKDKEIPSKIKEILLTWTPF